MVDYDPNLIGAVFEVTDPVPVTAQMVAEFCKATGDSGPLYTDEAAARQGPYGTIVAPPSYAITFRNGRQFFEHIPRFGRQGFDAGGKTYLLMKSLPAPCDKAGFLPSVLPLWGRLQRGKAGCGRPFSAAC